MRVALRHGRSECPLLPTSGIPAVPVGLLNDQPEGGRKAGGGRVTESLQGPTTGIRNTGIGIQIPPKPTQSRNPEPGSLSPYP